MNSKKVIAREGLILLGCVVAGLAIYFTARHLNNVYLIQHHEARMKVMQNMQYSLVGYTPYIKMMSLGLNTAILGYPVFGVVRFILWAFKTLKKK